MASGTSARRVCLLGAAVCFGVLLIPGFSTSRTAEGRTTSIRMGLPFSPWFHLKDERSEQRQEKEGSPTVTTEFRTSWKVEFISWSAFSALLGLGFLTLAKYLRKRSGQTQPDGLAPAG
jgi:hypothetical protein